MIAAGPTTAAASAAAERLGAALGRLADREGDGEVDAARDAVREVLALHAAAMARLVEIAKASGEAGGALVRALGEDELVGNVLALHGLHPVPLDQRVRAALDRAAPVLAGLGASVASVEIRPDVVKLDLATDGPGAAVLARVAEDAICAAAPDAPPLEVVTSARATGVIPVERLLERRRDQAPAAAQPERCELCGATIGAAHEHLVDPAKRALVCACAACLHLAGGAQGRWRRVARQARSLPGFNLRDARWADLGVPVDVAFFMDSSVAGKVMAFYPSPAGATESLLALDAWQALLADNPGFAPLEPDVEALLVRRADGVSASYRVSIDLAYELVGVLRKHWRGLSGGPEARSAVADFFARLASPQGGPSCSV